MPLHNEWLTFEDGGSTYSMFVSRQSKAEGPLPAVIVLQEIWGVDPHIRDITERFAKAGYLAVAPDLFTENGVRHELLAEERIDRVRSFLHSAPPQAFRDPAVREEALAKLPADERSIVKPSADKLLSSFTRLPEFLEIVRAAFRFLQRYEFSSGRAASVGYCMGGALSAGLASSEPELAGAVVYYGRLTADLAPNIQCPVLGFFGGLDEGITSLVPDFAKSMEENGKTFTSHIYNKAKHAFFNDTGAGYDVNAARDAWDKTISFLNASLAR